MMEERKFEAIEVTKKSQFASSGAVDQSKCATKRRILINLIKTH
jgi:hypothetical protein